MKVLVTILAVVNLLIAIALVILIVQQDNDDQGLGTLSGNNIDSYYSGNRGRTKDVFMRRLTTILAVVFVVINVVLGFLVK